MIRKPIGHERVKGLSGSGKANKDPAFAERRIQIKPEIDIKKTRLNVGTGVESKETT